MGTVFHQYFLEWMETYKKPVVQNVTYIKYEGAYRSIKRYFGDKFIEDLTPKNYQSTINKYASTHAKLTVSQFNKMLRACIKDAIDEEIIHKDPTRKVVITGVERKVKTQCLNYEEWVTLLQYTYHSYDIKDHIIYIGAVTGMRYAEILGMTWNCVDYTDKTFFINKTWDYKYHTGFIPTKNKMSTRTIDVGKDALNLLLRIQEKEIEDKHNRVFVEEEGNLTFHVSRMNTKLKQVCRELDIPRIHFHCLRHTHASILLYKGIDIMSVSRRLGHSQISTTQSVYAHIIKEMQERDKQAIIGTIDGHVSDHK